MEDYKIVFEIDFKQMNADELQNKMQQLMDILDKANVSYKSFVTNAEKGTKEVNTVFTDFLEKIDSSLLNFYYTIGEKDIWTNIFGKFSSKWRGDFLDYLWTSSQTYSKNVEALWKALAEKMSEYSSIATKVNIENLQNQLREVQGTLKQHQIDSLNDLQQTAEEMRETVLQILGKIGIGAYMKGNEMAKQYVQGITEELQNLTKRDWDIIYERYFQRYPLDISQFITSGTIQPIDFEKLLEEARRYVSEYKKLLEKYGTDVENIYNEIGTRETDMYKKRRSALMEMGIQMWFLSTAIRQVEDTLKLLNSTNEITYAQLELINQALNSLTYGWFGMSKMLEMYMQKLMIKPGMGVAEIEKLTAIIGQRASLIALALSSIVAILPIIVQWQNKIDEGFLKMISNLSKYEGITQKIFSSENVLEWVSALTEFEKEYHKIFKEVDITKLLPSEIELIIRPKIEEKALIEFMRTRAGGDYLRKFLEEQGFLGQELERMYKFLHPSMIEGFIQSIFLLLMPDIKKEKQKIYEEWIPFMQQLFEESAGITKEGIQKMESYWAQYESYVKDKLKGTQEEVKTYSDIELDIKRRQAEIEGETELAFELELEQKKRELQRAGIYTQEEVDQILLLMRLEHNKEILESEKSLQAQILELQGKKRDAFLLNLEIEIEGLRQKGIAEELLQQYQAERIKQYDREVWLSKQNFYKELATLRGEDDEAFRISLEMQKQGFIELGISAVEIKEWETLQWKKYEEEKTEKLRQEEEKRLLAYNDFLKSYYRLKGMDVEARKIEWEEMYKNWEKSGILPEIPSETLEEYKDLYIYQEKYKVLEQLSLDYQKLISSETDFELSELRRRVEEFKKAGLEKIDYAFYVLKVLENIGKQETENQIRELEKRLNEMKREADQEIEQIKRIGEARKDLYVDIIRLGLTDDIDKKLLDLELKRRQLLETTKDVELVNQYVSMSIWQIIDEENKRRLDEYNKSLENIANTNKELQDKINKYTLGGFQYEMELLKEKVNAYVKAGADIALVTKWYYLEGERLQKEATEQYIQDELRKYETVQDINERIKNFREKQMGIKKPESIRTYEETLSEAKDLIKQIMFSTEFTEQEKEKLIKDIISSVNLDRYGLTGKAIQELWKYVEELKKIQTTTPVYSVTPIEKVITETPTEVKPPKLITEEEINERMELIRNKVDEGYAIVEKFVNDSISLINSKLVESIINDEVIQSIIDKILTIPDKLQKEVDWYGIGIDIGSKIAEGGVEAVKDIIKKILGLDIEIKFPGEETIQPPPGGRAGVESAGVRRAGIEGAGVGRASKEIPGGGLEPKVESEIYTPPPEEEIKQQEIYTIAKYILEAYSKYPKEGKKLFASENFENISYEEAGWLNILTEQFLPTYLGGSNIAMEYYEKMKQEENLKRIEYYESLAPIKEETTTTEFPGAKASIETAETKPSKHIEVKVYVGERELKDIVTEIVEKEVGGRSV